MLNRHFIALVFLALPGVASAQNQWADWPPGPRDAELEAIVRTAYTAATAHARSNLNYFARDGDTDALRDAIADALTGEDFADLDLSLAPAASLDEARACPAEGVVLRFAPNMFGDGISLAAASAERVFSYHYDPHVDAAILVAPAEPCADRS